MIQKSSSAKKSFDPLPEIHSLAKKEELGELCKVYSVPKQNTGLFVLGAFCILAAGFVFLLQFGLKPPPILPGIILLLIGCLIVFARRIYVRWHIYLWQYGFIYEKGRKRLAFRWDQIENIQGDPSHYTIQHKDGYKITLTVNIGKFGELLDIIVAEFVRHLATQDLIIPPRRTLRTFSPTKIDRQGIGDKKETLPWQDIQEFITMDGRITIRQRDSEEPE